MQLFAVAASAPLENLTHIVITIGMIALAALVIWLVISWAWRRTARARMLRHGELPNSELEHYRTYLVTEVGEASRTRGRRVKLRGAWHALNRSRGSRLTAAQRYVILDDLLQREVFQRAYDEDAFVRFLQHLRWVGLQRPVSVVKLSELDWQRLASGSEASMVANGGDIIVVNDSPGAGVMSRNSDSHQRISTDLQPQAVLDIVKALRSDAAQLQQGHPLRTQAESYARDLETEMGRGQQGRVKEIIQDVLSFASNAASLWVSTLSFFPK